jgi:beta-phosphoglucomutase-like phosphatase (HAD superfamily)
MRHLHVLSAPLVGGRGLVRAAVAFIRRTPVDNGRTAIDPERYDAVVFDLDAVVQRTDGVRALPGTVELIVRLRYAGIEYAVTSVGLDCADILRAAGLEDVFQVRVDGVVAAERGLPGKPDPAMFLLAAHRLGVLPRRTVVIEDAPSGVVAGRAGGFGMVVAVDRAARRDELLAAGADVVVQDFNQLDIGQSG